MSVPPSSEEVTTTRQESEGRSGQQYCLDPSAKDKPSPSSRSQSESVPKVTKWLGYVSLAEKFLEEEDNLLRLVPLVTPPEVTEELKQGTPGYASNDASSIMTHRRAHFTTQEEAGELKPEQVPKRNKSLELLITLLDKEISKVDQTHQPWLHPAVPCQQVFSQGVTVYGLPELVSREMECTMEDVLVR